MKLFVPILALLTCLFVAFMLWAIGSFVADDAFIVGRYALNAVDGLGLVYNQGEYVSALTSPLQAIFLTGLALVTEAPVEMYRVIAPLLALAGFLAAWAVARPARDEVLFIAVFALASPFAIAWARGGLETGLLFAVIFVHSAVIYRLFKRPETPDAAFYGLAVLCGLAFLLRHDSILVTLPPMLGLAWDHWRRPALWRAAGVALAIAGAWLGFSWLYYESLLPTSAFIKLGPSSFPTINSVAMTANFLTVSALPLLWVLGRAGPGLRDRKALCLGIAASAFLFAGYACFTSGEHMMFGYRAFVPYLPALAFLLAPRLARAGRVAPAAAGVLAVQVWAGFYVGGQGITYAPLKDVGLFEEVDLEHTDVPAFAYGRAIFRLEDNAEDLRRHWRSDGDGGEARVFLFTGGMGYWLRDFYVFETLVSYRHGCGDFERFAQSAHYLQIYPAASTNALRRTAFESHGNRSGRVVLLPDVVGPADIRYAFSSDPQPSGFLPATVHGACRF